MRRVQALSRRSKLALSFTTLALLLGSGTAFAHTQRSYTSDYGFQVIDPYQPYIVTWVNGSFANQPVKIYVNMSSQEGVGHLSGTYSVIVQIWNDTSGGFVNFQSLASNKSVTLTPTPVTLQFTFSTDTPGEYNVHVEFTATSATSG